MHLKRALRAFGFDSSEHILFQGAIMRQVLETRGQVVRSHKTAVELNLPFLLGERYNERTYARTSTLCFSRLALRLG